jgi:hypothetical protein
MRRRVLRRVARLPGGLGSADWVPVPDAAGAGAGGVLVGHLQAPGLTGGYLLLPAASFPHDVARVVGVAVEASVGQLLLNRVHCFVFVDAGRNHNPALLQLLDLSVRLPPQVFNHIVVVVRHGASQYFHGASQYFPSARR